MTLPLDDLKILDFSGHLPAPFATLYMADLGADILKITSSTRPDPISLLPPFLPGSQMSSVHAYVGRNKRSMALNLKDSRSREIVHRLIGEYDIVIEQFRPGVMARLGLDYENLKKVNPALIYCSVSSYGQTGQKSFKGGHDLNFVARSGMLSYTGRKDSRPAPCGAPVADLAGGTLSVITGVLSAVIARIKTGEGQYIDISLTDGSVVALNSFSIAEYLACGSIPGYESNLFNGGSLYDIYETKDGRYMSFCALEPHFFSAFCRTIGRPDLAYEQGMAPQNPDEV
ncbi:MAG TPA: CaiB/BaiF CoA-transferase family protein, partial [Smithellaceae bacterium]|nr:CaiB/BaiF CoA-transferase family protein [Smithellaceae bacterium]